MGPNTEELIQVLERMIPLLEWDGCHWADWMRKVRDELAASDFHGVRRLLNAYGGMGSFNDLVVGYRLNESGQLQQRSGCGEKNAELERLRTGAYELATLLKREHETGA